MEFKKSLARLQNFKDARSNITFTDVYDFEINTVGYRIMLFDIREAGNSQLRISIETEILPHTDPQQLKPFDKVIYAPVGECSDFTIKLAFTDSGSITHFNRGGLVLIPMSLGNIKLVAKDIGHSHLAGSYSFFSIDSIDDLRDALNKFVCGMLAENVAVNLRVESDKFACIGTASPKIIKVGTYLF